MNVNSGGPHILLFERDQQLTGLLISEFQLAGYECHTARTAVEVFDAIARFPIRLVLVNLAQAAANRREFWVALDAQRRGRGVQVFTFRCMNLAGYGPDDPDDRSRIYLTDMEVDGMLGVMNLVDAVRARVPGSIKSTTGSFTRLNAQPQGAAGQNAPPAQAASQPTPSMPVPANSSTGGVAAAASAPEPGIAPRMGMPSPTFTDKIRAVIYPGNRSYSPTPEANWAPHAAPPSPPRPPHPVSNADAASRPPASSAGEATGLEQLSRMVHESGPAWARETPSSKQPAVAPAPLPAQEREAPYKGPRTDQVNIQDILVENRPPQPVPVQQAQPIEPESIADLGLRPSPIEDLPIERIPPRPAAPPPPAGRANPGLADDAPTPTAPLPAVHPVPPPAQSSSAPEPPASEEAAGARTQARTSDTTHRQEKSETEPDQALDRLPVEQLPNVPVAQRGRNNPPSTSEEVLLDIVQSLPPVGALPAPPSTPPRTPVLNGRATRSLGNVLLEGHLVPQHRLEVAQNIQRMLSGVDLNYQLGEILLMFKLLTPDQLLAASLVSYGLISAAQISGLGRIRQELHLMGLEYDLESLLVLFRILTPDQLREVRASWSS